MKKDTLISIIIPIYNVEQYLKKCLDSVINQTYKNIEIICVNDCSPDNSINILELYSKKDNRIKIINREKNGGLSAARNTGLDNATGEYIYFLDSDDWIELDFLEKMYNAIVQNKLNAVCCANVLNVYADNTSKHFIKRNNEGFAEFSQTCQMAWCWLIKKEYLDKFKIIFPNGLKYEDTWFYYVVIRNLEKFYIITSTTYYHIENPNSIMGKSDNRKIDNFDIIENLELIFDNYKELNKLKDWSIPFFYMPKYMLNIHQNKFNFYKKLRDFLIKIEKDVNENQGLYSKMELDFLKDILKYESYNEYKKLDLSIIATLRKNLS